MQMRHGNLFGMESIWSTVSFLCLIVAAVLGWFVELDAAFVAATLGVLAWFFNLRNRLRQSSIEAGNTSSNDKEVEGKHHET